MSKKPASSSRSLRTLGLAFQISLQAITRAVLTQTAMVIRDEIAYHEYEGIAVDLSERERIIHDLGDKSAMIFRNHGTLTVGETVGEAFLKLYFLERACDVDLGLGLLRNLGPPSGCGVC